VSSSGSIDEVLQLEPAKVDAFEERATTWLVSDAFQMVNVSSLGEA